MQEASSTSLYKLSIHHPLPILKSAEAEMFNIKQKENRGFISSSFGLGFWLLLFLTWTFGASSVTIEETIGTIPESTSTNSLSANKYMAGVTNEGNLSMINNTDMGSPSINTTIYNPQIFGSNASNSVTEENLTSFELSERRKMLGANADTDSTANGKSSSINYNDIPHAYTRPNSSPNKAANPYQKPCNPADRCRQGN